MRNQPTRNTAIAILLAIAVVLSNLSLALAQTPTPLKFTVLPAAIPAGRTRTIKIKTESGADLTDFELQKPPSDSGVVFEEPGAQLADEKTTIIARVKVEEDADEQSLPLTLVKKKEGKVIATYTVDLTISGFSPKVKQKQPIPSGLNYEVDAMVQPMSYQGAKDIFGRRVANGYYAVVVSLGNNTGFDLQINKVGFITTIPMDAPVLDKDDHPVLADNKPTMRHDLLQITAIDRSLVRSSIEKDQNFGTRALALNLIGGVGTLTTGFLPFFHALGPKANFSSFTSVVNGQLKDGFTTAVPDLTIRHLNHLDNSLVMDQDFVLANNSERNTVVFVPRKALQLDKDHMADGKDHRDDLLLVRQKLGQIVIVGRKIDIFENRQIVVRSDRPSSEPEPFVAPATAVATGPISIERITPDAGLLSESTDVVITGTGFTPGAAVKVKFGDRQTTGVALTANTVQATVPTNATSAKVDVQVIVGEKQTPPVKEGYTYIDELRVDSVVPATVSATANVTVKINGKGFMSGATVTVSDGAGTNVVQATNVSVSNDHNVITATIPATVPAHAKGAVNVEVKNPNGKKFSKANGFTYTE